ncbi:MAG: DUF5655 domain-containing protein [Acidobacteria bacterium]|nr:DUF5655 domain-containing protein [Acidobacteriota bacterium]
MKGDKKPLWTCPKCGHQFVTRNMWHSCSNYPIEYHFIGRDPIVRRLFDEYVEFVERCGPVTVYAQKTRIIFQTRARFTGVVVRKTGLECHLWLKRRVESPRFHRIESLGSRDHVHYFRLTDPSQLDDELAGLLKEAYAVGSQDYQGREKTKQTKNGRVS